MNAPRRHLLIASKMCFLDVLFDACLGISNWKLLRALCQHCGSTVAALALKFVKAYQAVDS